MDQLYNIAINDSATTGAGYDPLTKLRSRTFYGRPDFKSIYTRLRSAIEHGAFLGVRETRACINIGTYFCGVRSRVRFYNLFRKSDSLILRFHQPGALAKVVKENALECSTPTANFTFAKVGAVLWSHLPNRPVDVTLSTGTLLMACVVLIRYISFAARLQLAGFPIAHLLCLHDLFT